MAKGKNLMFSHPEEIPGEAVRENYREQGRAQQRLIHHVALENWLEQAQGRVTQDEYTWKIIKLTVESIQKLLDEL